MGQGPHQRGLCSEWKWQDLIPELYEAKGCTGTTVPPLAVRRACVEVKWPLTVFVVVELRDTTSAIATEAQWSTASYLALFYSELTLYV